MKKIVIIACVALLCFGCSKQKEESDTLNTPVTENGTKDFPYPWDACIWWWDGHDCYHWQLSDSICYVSLADTCMDSPVVPILLSYNEGHISEMIIVDVYSLPEDYSNAFLSFVEAGTITFREDSYVYDEDLIYELTYDYVPAGTYPIRLSDNNSVITIPDRAYPTE